MSMKYKRLLSPEEIKEGLYQFEDCYPRLVNRVVDFDAFSRKLATYGIVIGLEDLDILKGIICFYANDSVNYIGFISIIWIRQNNRNEGTGTKLLKHCMEIMKERGMKFVELEVQTSNTKAISFYKKNGFIEKHIDYEKNSCFMIRTL